MKAQTASGFLLYTTVIHLCLFLTGITCLAAQAPIQIEADRMTSVEKSRSVIFTGNVDAKQDQVRIRADKMTVYYLEGKTKKAEKSQNSQEIDKIICEGSVEVTSEKWLGTSDVMHYFSKKNLVQLIGNAKAYQGQNTIEGQKIDYHLDTGKSEVFGGTNVQITDGAQKKEKPKRVNMTIMQQ